MHLHALAGRDKTVHGKSGWFAKGRVCRRQALQNRLESCITACDAVLMRPLPLRVRLTARYFLVLCLAFGAFSLLPFFRVRGSIHSAVDEGLRDRAADLCELLERQSAEQIKLDLTASSSVRGEDDILEIAESHGEWSYSSVSALQYGLRLPATQKLADKFLFSTMYSKGMPLKILAGQLHIGKKTYDFQIALQWMTSITQ